MTSADSPADDPTPAIHWKRGASPTQVLYSANGVIHVAAGAVDSGTTFVVDGLSEKGVYSFGLRAHNAKGWSQPGKFTAEITLPACGASRPQPPSKPRLTQIGSCSATVAWARVAGQATGGAAIDQQQVHARPKGATHESGTVISVDVPARATEAVIEGLQGGTSYFFSVRVRNVLGWSEHSAAVSGGTPEATGSRQPSRPMAPRQLEKEEMESAGAAAASEGRTTERGRLAAESYTGATACDVMHFEMPALRAGCDHDDYLTLEWLVPPSGRALQRASAGAGSSNAKQGADETALSTAALEGTMDEPPQVGEWRPVPTASFVEPPLTGAASAGMGFISLPAADPNAVPRLHSRRVTLNGLDPNTAYYFRTVAHNAAGSSLPSAASAPMLTQLDGGSDALAAPPKVIATSSSSYLLMWSDSQERCRGDLRWRVAVRRGSTSTSAASAGDVSPVQLLNASVAGHSFSANSLRCPEGCAFSVTVAPESLGGYSPPATPVLSDPIPTPRLPALVDGAQRLELKLSIDFGAEDLLLVQQELREQMAAALAVDSARIAIAQTYAAGQYYIVDLLPDADAAGASPSDLVERLRKTASDLSNPMFDTRVLGQLDAIRRIDMIDAVGRSSDIIISDDVQQRGTKYAKTSIAELLVLIAFAGGVLLAAGLIAGSECAHPNWHAH